MPSVFRALENDCRRATANLPLWLCGLFSFLLTLAAPAVFWLLVGPGFCLIPTGIFMLLALTFAIIFEDDWEEGNPASLWSGVTAAALGFTIAAVVSAFFVSWWLALLALAGIGIVYDSVRESVSNANSQGWNESIEIVNGFFRHPTLVAVVVQLAWKAGAIGTIIGLFCALMTVQTVDCFGFLGEAALSIMLFFASFAFIRHYAYHPHRQPELSDDLERRGRVKIPHRGD